LFAHNGDHFRGWYSTKKTNERMIDTLILKHGKIAPVCN
jgi:hypothetical protein